MRVVWWQRELLTALKPNAACNSQLSDVLYCNCFLHKQGKYLTSVNMAGEEAISSSSIFTAFQIFLLFPFMKKPGCPHQRQAFILLFAFLFLLPSFSPYCFCCECSWENSTWFPGLWVRALQSKGLSVEILHQARHRSSGSGSGLRWHFRCCDQARQKGRFGSSRSLVHFRLYRYLTSLGCCPGGTWQPVQSTEHRCDVLLPVCLAQKMGSCARRYTMLPSSLPG